MALFKTPNSKKISINGFELSRVKAESVNLFLSYYIKRNPLSIPFKGSFISLIGGKNYYTIIDGFLFIFSKDDGVFHLIDVPYNVETDEYLDYYYCNEWLEQINRNKKGMMLISKTNMQHVVSDDEYLSYDEMLYEVDFMYRTSDLEKYFDTTVVTKARKEGKVMQCDFYIGDYHVGRANVFSIGRFAIVSEFHVDFKFKDSCIGSLARKLRLDNGIELINVGQAFLVDSKTDNEIYSIKFI